MTVDAPSPMALAFTLASHCHLPLKTATTVMVRQLFVHFYYIVSQFSSYFLSYFVVVLYVWFLFCPLDLRKDHVRKLIVGLQFATSCISLPISHTYLFYWMAQPDRRVPTAILTLFILLGGTWHHLWSHQLIRSGEDGNYTTHNMTQTYTTQILLERRLKTEARYQVHQQYLSRCTEQNLAPKGLILKKRLQFNTVNPETGRSWQTTLWKAACSLRDVALQTATENIAGIQPSISELITTLWENTDPMEYHHILNQINSDVTHLRNPLQKYKEKKNSQGPPLC